MPAVVLLGLLLWWCLLEAKLLEGVPILSLVILLDAAVPTAQNIVMLVLVHGTPEHGQVGQPRRHLDQSRGKSPLPCRVDTGPSMWPKPDSSPVSVGVVQALAYVILWQYAMSVPFLIMYVAVFLALINDIYF